MTLKNKRILALIIDLLIIGAITAFVSRYVTLKTELETVNFADTDFMVGFSFAFLLFLLYFILIDIFNEGKTVGKVTFKLKVVSKNGQELKLSNRLCRSVFKFFSYSLFPISVVLYLINGASLHDWVCKTKTIFI